MSDYLEIIPKDRRIKPKKTPDVAKDVSETQENKSLAVEAKRGKSFEAKKGKSLAVGYMEFLYNSKALFRVGSTSGATHSSRTNGSSSDDSYHPSSSSEYIV